MAGYRTFETSRVSFGKERPKAPLVNIALVRGPHLTDPAKAKPSVKTTAAKSGPDAKVGQEGFVPPKAVRPEDFEDQRAFPMKRLGGIVAAVTGVSVTELQSHRRRPNQVKARQILFWLGKTYTGLTMSQIAHRVGRRDHTTAMWGIRKVQAVMDRLEIEKSDCPIVATERLWAAEWPKVSR